MLPSLTALIEVQRLDSAADQARKRLAEMPGAEAAIAAKRAEATRAVEAVKAQVAENTTTRRNLEKDVAAVDSRMTRFDEHKAAVRTNQEYTALLHEITAAKSEKDAIEEKILELMERADTLAVSQKEADAALAAVAKDSDKARAALVAERAAIETDVARLTSERARAAAQVEAPLLNKYEQLLKQRKGVAVAAIVNELCTACHVRLRQQVLQSLRKGDTIVQCDSCQRIVYLVAPAAS